MDISLFYTVPAVFLLCVTFVAVLLHFFGITHMDFEDFLICLFFSLIPGLNAGAFVVFWIAAGDYLFTTFPRNSHRE